MWVALWHQILSNVDTNASCGMTTTLWVFFFVSLPVFCCNDILCLCFVFPRIYHCSIQCVGQKRSIHRPSVFVGTVGHMWHFDKFLFTSWFQRLALRIVHDSKVTVATECHFDYRWLWFWCFFFFFCTCRTSLPPYPTFNIPNIHIQLKFL